ncbi:MAG TPA: transposase [Solirubrobacteraceae bacterium]|nr:transposase [Solirubrobacteraceae bacterium]
MHHVYARGNAQQPIYLDDVDRLTYLGLLGRVIGLTGWCCLAYCLMDNHVHLLVETPRPNLGVGMQDLHGRYGRRFNDRHDRSGHLFQGRFGAKRVTRDVQLWATVRYIAMNPVNAGLCHRPDQWRWGSAGASPPWLGSQRLLEYLGAEGGDPIALYAELVSN